MRISTFWYCMKQGMINIRRNKLFSLASVATISACIFLFCLFFAIIANIEYIVKNVESTVGVNVFFDEGLSEAQITSLGASIKQMDGVLDVRYTSAEEAWESVKKDYFEGMEELAEGFAEDNPLADSASYEIFLTDISQQPKLVEELKALPGIRRVNYSDVAAAGLSDFNKLVGYLSVAIIGILLAVAVFLISNTISVAAAFRKDETKIMKLIGAKNGMIRAPFIVEGVLIGLVGAALPLGVMFFVYKNAVEGIVERFAILSNVIVFLPLESIFKPMTIVAMALGVGIGFFGSSFTIRKHLRV